ncbi:S8 family serine peptidase, partial [Candidatus Woesearchaeota archaeon]|nr:S8 family serine peptidase [Candidatus Woesearchaeota archaeon]
MKNNFTITKNLVLPLALVLSVLFFVPNNVFGFGLCDSSTQSNLFVSSQNSQSLNHFAGPQVIEVAVCNPDIQATGEAQGEPDVTVNGKKLRMVQSSDGSWYAFFADRAMAQLADSTTTVVGRGLDFGRFCSSTTQQNVTGISLSETSGFALPRDGRSGSNGQSSMNACTSIGSGTTISNHVIRNPPSLNSAAPQTGQIGIISDAWPLIQLYDFTPTGNVIVTYNKGGGSQTLSSPFDISGTATISVESSTTLDPATNVPIKISDFQLNIDPTSIDSWTLGTSTAIPKVYYQLFSGDSVDGDGKGLADLKSSLSGMMFENNGYLTVDNTNSILEIKDNSDQVLIAYGNQLGTSSIGPGEFPVTITEQSANVGVFSNWDSQNNANIKTVANNAQLASKTATISYNAITKTIQYNLPAPPAQSNPTITLSPTSSLAGTEVAISGSGFPPDTTIPVAFDGITLNSFSSSATGTFSGIILIPNFATAGIHSVQASPGTAHSASATFTVTVQTISEEEQHYKEAYDGLPQKFEDKVEPPVIEDYTGVQKPPKVAEPKQDTKIYEIAKSPNPQQYAIDSGLDYKDGKVRIVVTANPTQATLDKIKKVATVESVAGNQIQLAVDVKKIGEITKLTEVSSLRAPAKAVQSGTTSEGVEFVNAHKVQTKGTTGKGVKIAVLDLGFDTKNAELGTGLQSKSFRKDFGKAVDIKGFGHEYVHGTAVAEIIKDIAPGSQLYLYTFGTEAEFQEAMSEAIKQNVDIISMSAGWLNYPSDGSSVMTKKVEEAIKKGIPFIVSSGNYAETHWEGKYSDTVKNGWHEFSGKDEGLSIEV